jgi:hypothetical protein
MTDVARSAPQIQLFVILFLLYCRVKSWKWKSVATAVLLFASVYYVDWPFQVAAYQLWIDVGLATIAALALSWVIPQRKSCLKHECGICRVFFLLLYPIGLLYFIHLHIPQTSFPLGVFMSVIVAVGLMVIHKILCIRSLEQHVSLVGAAFVWGLIFHNWRFVPLFATLLTFALLLLFMKQHRHSHRTHKHLLSITSSSTSSSSSTTTSPGKLVLSYDLS